jgi:formylglycine-generating enzyme required for sulfatase activity
MALPSPLPDNPTRWEGWRSYNSDNLYERLCLDFEANPTTEQIEENCRQLLVWWQKKLPLKNQPSNPLAQLLRSGLDEAPAYLADARTKLLDPEIRAWHDSELRVRIVQDAVEQFKRAIPFAISGNDLTSEAEQRLYEAGAKLGLARDEMKAVVDAEIERLGVARISTAPRPAAPPASAAVGPALASPASRDPFDEFRRMLKLSKLCLDGEEMTDDQRDALCNMGESLGLTGGQAEDLIDEYLDEVSGMPMQPQAPPRAGTAVAAASRPAVKAAVPVVAKPKAEPALPAREMVLPPTVVVNTSPAARVKERERFPSFRNSAMMEMLLVPSGIFRMGSDAPDAAPHEQPSVETTVSCFHIGRFPVTNAQYELFDPAHRAKRPPWAGDNHPVVYVNSREALAFCQWLGARESRKYRLPTEAEWEYAARGTDGRTFPWGSRLDTGHYANFADSRTSFPWRDAAIDDGYAESSPVGAFPRGASPFFVEDMAGNVYEWCLDFFDFYRSGARVNPRGPSNGTKRVYRGGSWKSRAGSLRVTARAFNSPDYSSNDVGFRLVCECE